MRVDVLTREYPPEVYGGAGVHVAELVRALRLDIDTVVRCFGAPRDEPHTYAYLVPPQLIGANPALATLGIDLQMAQDAGDADLVHSHTWYANSAGRIAQLLHGIPHVVTAHSLEPLRPWKAEQLGGGYRVSSWIERGAFDAADAVIAVSAGMRGDILRSYPEVDPARVRVVHNGVDPQLWHRDEDPEAARALGLDPDRPSVLFVGRITRQKGLPYLLRAARSLPPEVQLVLCAGAPDTPEILAEVTAGVEALQAERTGVVWIDRMLQRRELAVLHSAATTFVCPSIYEPLGIVNLEAMACGAPVVGTATGGSPRWWTTASPAGWCPSSRPMTAAAHRWTPTASSRTSRPHSPRSWPTRRRRGAWARPAGGASSRSSAGRPSPSAPVRSTTRCSEPGRPPPLRLADHAPVLGLHDLTVVRDGKSILDDVSWEVEPDQRWVVLGPNGAGKTTLLQIVSANVHPSSGSATILGETLGRVDVFDLRPRIGFASTALARRIPANEAVLDVVMTAAYSVTGRWNEEYDDVDLRRARRVLAEWRLEHLEGRLFGTLSDGEQKRVQIARSVMTDPELLLLDEPAASLDLGAREELLQLLGAYATAPQSPAMIMVTHHVEEIPPGFTHALLLADGRIRAAGPIAEILTEEHLSEAFGVPLVVATSEDGRFSARARS
ncbi:hypothetical protein GCM10025881_39420 [Pseudolysinimonas kribbensis]|uniref:ABC transporter domain-containing protein n=1 Tax=Pseudolysinimonas kribbensis TaxID=433641 RepID=A0ABQ6KA66_9MICO|nr:hypothetical protein GCM10025881_00330 [Pseudolysinimonas kribbensis]GMA97118.1 hypothetical protein GCM10025881_39420 [Pseudolysinimonas kribbensis]